MYDPLHMQLFDRRGKMVYESEHDCWKHLTKECMSDESDNEDGTKTRHTSTPKWRSDSKLLLYPFTLVLPLRFPHPLLPNN